MQEFYRIMNDKEQRDFMRMNPVWYKEFNRVGHAHTQFKQVFDVAKKERTPSRLATIDKHLSTANLMLKLLKGFK
ncbi:MAG: hypothetical protein FWG67_00610 [Defluviitaleaceae bacterium]|nr:hypothetical protein [Defluviitaleaceae bacterium]